MAHPSEYLPGCRIGSYDTAVELAENQSENSRPSSLNKLLRFLVQASESTWRKAELANENVYQAFKKFTELKIFDPLQIEIKTRPYRLKSGKILHVPYDTNLNHYFIGK